MLTLSWNNNTWQKVTLGSFSAMPVQELRKRRRTLSLGAMQDGVNLVSEGGVALVGNGVGAHAHGFGVGFDPAVVRRGRAGTVRNLLIHTVCLENTQGLHEE